jgi:hypothetical protein
VQFEHSYNAVDVMNSWSVRIQKNSSQNNRRQQSGVSKTRLDYKVDSFGGWTVGSDFQLSRGFSRTDFTRLVANNSKLALVVGTGLPGDLLRRPTGADPEALDWQLTSSVGVTRETNVNQTRSRSAGSPLTRSDSTYASGSSWDLESKLQLQPGDAWNFSLDGGLGATGEDSRTDQPLLPDSLRVTTARNQNENRNLDFSGSWKAGKDTNLLLNAGTRREVNQGFNTLIGQSDTKVGTDKRVDLQLKAVPFWGVSTQVDAGANNTDTQWAVSDQDQGGRGKKIQGNVDFTLGRMFGFLREAEFEGEFEWENASHTYGNSPNYDEKTRRLKGTLRRAFGTRSTASVSAEANLNQSFYDRVQPTEANPHPASIQDRDILRMYIDSVFNYRISSQVNSSVNVQWNAKKTVYIAADRAQNNVTDASYRVGANYTWKILPDVSFAQRYAVTAVSSTFDRSEDRSNLVRTSEIRSKLDSQIGERTKLLLEHMFRYKDSGAFSRDFPGAPRLYGKDTEEVYQYLEVTTAYSLVPRIVDLKFEQKYEVRDTKSLSNDTRSTRPKTEQTWGSDIRHTFPGDIALRLKVDRTSSTQEPSYWNVIASVNKAF